MLNLPKQRPMCAVCGRPVDSMLVTEDESRGPLGTIIFVAHCHGAQEKVEVGFGDLLANGRQVEVTYAPAFVHAAERISIPPWYRARS